MYLTLQEWAGRLFSNPPHINTLRTWAKTGQIHPAPVIVAGRYQVDENARYIPLDDQHHSDPVVARILSDGCQTA